MKAAGICRTNPSDLPKLLSDRHKYQAGRLTPKGTQGSLIQILQFWADSLFLPSLMCNLKVMAPYHDSLITKH